MPITPEIMTAWAREFGILTAVLFVVLLTGITFIWFLVGKLSKTVDETKLILVERTMEFLPSHRTCKNVIQYYHYIQEMIL
jgi:hypothetical protein